MISCQHCEELLNARLDDQLSPEDARLLAEHLDQCPQCRRLDRDLTALHHGLGALSAQPPADLTAAILSQLEEPHMQPDKKKKKAPWAAIACAAAAVVLMAVVLTPQLSPFGGDAAAETAEGTESALMDTSTQEESTAGGAPAEDPAEPESQVEPLTEKEAQDLLIAYLIDLGVSLDLTDGNLAEDGSYWTFTGRDMDSGDRFLFTVYCSDGFVEEVLLP